MSPAREPHLHLPPDIGLHRPVERWTFETAIRWLILDKAPLSCSSAEAEHELAEVEAPHVLHRGWSSPLDDGYFKAMQERQP